MKAIILAAGRGIRMGGATADKPKGLTKIGDQPLLSLQAKAIKSADIAEIGIVTGYLADMLQDFGDTFYHNDEWQNSNMVWSLRKADMTLSHNDCIVSYSDIFYTKETVGNLAADPADVAISYDPQWLDLWRARNDDPLSDAETFMCDDKGMLLEIGRKPDSLEDVHGQYMGLLKFTVAGWQKTKQVIEGFSEARIKKMDMTTLLSCLLQNDIAIKCVPVSGPWGEVDTPEDAALYNKWFRQGKIAV